MSKQMWLWSPSQWLVMTRPVASAEPLAPISIRCGRMPRRTRLPLFVSAIGAFRWKAGWPFGPSPLIAAALPIPTAAGQPREGSGTLTRLVPLPDGQANFGFTFRIFDSTDPVWGDTRSFEERIRSSIQTELAGKTPTFIKVWTPWQRPDQRGKPYVPFSAAVKQRLAALPEVAAVSGSNHVEVGFQLSDDVDPHSGRRVLCVFSATDNGTIAGFECSLDFGDFTPCISPHTYRRFARGPHLFRVEAIDNRGFRDSDQFQWRRR